MKHLKKFPFEAARRISAKEVDSYRHALEKKLGTKKRSRGRPRKSVHEKYRAVAIRLHPKIIEWAKAEAKRRGVGYQTIINQRLLKLAA